MSRPEIRVLALCVHAGEWHDFYVLFFGFGEARIILLPSSEIFNFLSRWTQLDDRCRCLRDHGTETKNSFDSVTRSLTLIEKDYHGVRGRVLSPQFLLLKKKRKFQLAKVARRRFGVTLRKNEPLEVKRVRDNCALITSENDDGINVTMSVRHSPAFKGFFYCLPSAM